MFRRGLAPALAFGLVAAVAAAPQNPAPQAPVNVPVEKIDTAMNAKIRTEGLEHSKIMWIEHMLTDVYGPRPIGSPNHKAAADWAVKTMQSWGMQNAHLEPFTWQGEGWLPGRATGFITSPVKQNLKFESIPWAPSTNGTVSGDVVLVLAPQNPTEEELDAYLQSIAPKVRGGIVMVGNPAEVPVQFNEPNKRIPDDQAKARYEPRDPNAPAAGRGNRGGGPGGGRGRGAGANPPEPGHLTAQQVNARITTLLRDNRPALRLTENGDARRIPGVIVAQNGAGQQYREENQIGAGVILRNDDYGRIARIIADGTPVKVEFNVQNQYFPEGSTSYVTVGEIPGTDKADEVVMLGGHLDSWTSATGATDNAIGCAIMLEAARILETVGAKPRRTIRVALWSGEEEGLLGSFKYVANHFGSAENPKPDFAKLDAYWNIDDGTGRVRGAGVFGPPEAAAVVAQYLKPFEDFGVYGASASTARVEGGSDNGAFAVAGLPGIGGQQDPIEYNSTTWHTNLDTYERIVPEDVMHNAVVSAALVYGLAMRDEMLPRFGKDMPAVPAGRGGGAGAGAGRGNGPAGPIPADTHVYVGAKAKPLAVPAPGLTGFTGRPAADPAPDAPKPLVTTVAIVTQPAHGKVLFKPDGSFTYTPEATFVGTDKFTYTTTRNGTTSAPGNVFVVVK